MIAHFSELDGSMFQEHVSDPPPRQCYAPIFTRCELREAMGISLRKYAMRTYRLVGVSGDIAFYDRVVDLSDLEE